MTVAEDPAPVGDGAEAARDAAREVALSVGALGVGMLVASGTPVIVADASLEGLAVSAWRFWLAAAGFVVLVASRRRLRPSVLRETALSGICFAGATALYFSALQLTSVANATLISVMQPLPLVVAARFMFRERITRPDLGWIGLALSGATFMILAADSAGTSDLGGDLLAAGSTLTAAGYFIFGKRARESLDTDQFMAGLLFWGSLTIAPIALASGQSMTPPDAAEWLRLGALAAIVGIGHMLINFANGRVPLAVLGLFQLTIPVCAGVMAWLFLDQQITVWQGLGMGVVLIALAAHTRHSSRVRRAEAAAAPVEPVT